MRRGLETLKNRNADARNDRNGEKGDSALAYAAQQMLKTLSLIHI